MTESGFLLAAAPLLPWWAIATLGLAGALALTRSIASMLVDVRPGDPLTLAAIAAFFFVLAAAASWPPAWRAARLDPTTALRE
jgi:ABC-type lipoprotein release transport system permease subunit